MKRQWVTHTHKRNEIGHRWTEDNALHLPPDVIDRYGNSDYNISIPLESVRNSFQQQRIQYEVITSRMIQLEKTSDRRHKEVIQKLDQIRTLLLETKSNLKTSQQGKRKRDETQESSERKKSKTVQIPSTLDSASVTSAEHSKYQLIQAPSIERISSNNQKKYNEYSIHFLLLQAYYRAA